MKISKVIFHIKPILSHPWWECKNDIICEGSKVMKPFKSAIIWLNQLWYLFDYLTKSYSNEPSLVVWNKFFSLINQKFDQPYNKQIIYLIQLNFGWINRIFFQSEDIFNMFIGSFVHLSTLNNYTTHFKNVMHMFVKVNVQSIKIILTWKLLKIKNEKCLKIKDFPDSLFT